jgi:hypothetical protein
MYLDLKKDQLAKLAVAPGNRFSDAEKILDDLVLNKEFAEFLTIPAYQFLKQN